MQSLSHFFYCLIYIKFSPLVFPFHFLQLEGGIHRYLESFPDGGCFKGKNFVFDSRVSVGPEIKTEQLTETKTETKTETESEGVAEATQGNVVGRCIDCSTLYDVYSGHIVCTVCRMPVLVCTRCVHDSTTPGEYHCSRHR